MAVSEKTALRHDLWKRQILDIVRRMPDASRALIKRTTGLSMESSLSLVDELLREGLILSVGKSDSGRAGRKATILKINEGGCYFIGIRFSAGSISGVCMDFGRCIICAYESEFEAPPSANAMVGEIASCIDALIGQLGDKRERLLGIGIGAPGIIDLKRGVITRYVHIPGWENIPLQDMIKERYGVPAYLEHGVKCTTRAIMTLAEHAQSRTLLFVQMGRGINMCSVVDGHILNGASYLAGEIGHMHVESNEILCECGKTGCLETVTASGVLVESARQSLSKNSRHFSVLKKMLDAGSPLNLKSLCLAADAGCPGCLDLIKKAGDAVGYMLSAAIMIINPEEVILSGRLSDTQSFRSAVKEALARRCLSECLATTSFTFIPNDARLDALGAAELPFQKEFGVIESGASPRKGQ